MPGNQKPSKPKTTQNNIPLKTQPRQKPKTTRNQKPPKRIIKKRKRNACSTIKKIKQMLAGHNKKNKC